MNTEPEPLIVGFGRTYVDSYPVAEYRESLVRAFRGKKPGFIVLDDNTRGQKFLAACVAWAIDNGYLYTSQTDSDGQTTVSAFRLTDLGEREFR